MFINYRDCAIHEPLAELDTTTGYHQDSLTYALSVPAQLTVRSSWIPVAGLIVFADSFINRGVRVRPYDSRKVAREGMEAHVNMAYAREVSGVVSGASLVSAYYLVEHMQDFSRLSLYSHRFM